MLKLSGIILLSLTAGLTPNDSFIFAGEAEVKAAAKRVTQIIAHRGASAERPECTLAAIQRAIEVGATTVEVDVRTSRDGELFILHDATLDRTTNGSGSANALTLEQLQQLDAGSWFGEKYSGEKIPSLIQAARACRGSIDLLLDLKEQGEEYDRKVVGTIQKYGDPAKTIIGVRSVEQAKRFRRLLPKSKQLGLIPSVDSIEEFAEAGVETIRLWPKWITENDEPITRVRKTGKMLHLNGTLGERAETLKLLSFQPDSLSSDHPVQLKRTLERIAAAKRKKASGELTKSTYTYKEVNTLKIQADVYRRQYADSRPVVLWLHGGALIMGSRSGVPQQLKDLAERENYIIVSLDYRLAPETKLPEIVEDIRDGVDWVRNAGPNLFQADPQHLVVAGASAGGYLSLMTGTFEHPPNALVSYWGFGDIVGDWTTKPSPAYRKGKLIERASALAGVGQIPITETNQANGRGRSTYFLYLKQTGLWVSEVSGWDPDHDIEKLKPYCPVQNVTKEYPPTLFLHGTADTDVPVEQTQLMAGALKREDVSHEVITIEGGGHSLWGGDREKINQAFDRSMEYIHERLSE